MRDLYPDPPHLSVSLYSENLTEDAAFAALCRAVQEAGGTPTGTLQTFPRSFDFCWASELTDVSQTQTVADDSFWPLVEGTDPRTRVAKAGLTADTPGLVVVSLKSKGDDDPSRHPLAASMYADQLGIPVQLWEEGDEVRANKIATWAEGLMRTACDSITPLYAALMVEETLPTPPELDELRSKDVFVPNRLLAADRALEPDLRNHYGEDRISRWSTGIFCAGWQGFHPGRTYQKQVPAAGTYPGTRIQQAISATD